MNELKGPVCVNWGSSLFFPQHGSGHASLLQIENDLMFLLDITFHLRDLDLQMQGKNSSGWDLATALCSFRHIFSNADGKVDFCIMKEGRPCVQTCTKQSSDTQKNM